MVRRALHFVEEFSLRADAAGNGLQGLPLAIRIETSALKQLYPTEDRVERATQVVCDTRKQFVALALNRVSVRTGSIALGYQLSKFDRRIGVRFHDGFVTTVMPDGVMKWFLESRSGSNPIFA